ncbi:DUF2390 domain-containing protein [Hydrogenophaga sp.]|uniref:DUF2390 domain-containing protein n=1 Tax=Hydrogenophaga sp. TaxID=1904254 RepID=UPI003F707357
MTDVKPVSRQDAHGLDIVLHLFQGYSALRLGRSLTPDEVASAESQIAGWRFEVILPLRRLHRALEDPPGFAPGQPESAQALRTLIARAELEAEQPSCTRCATGFLRWRPCRSMAPTSRIGEATATFLQEDR